MMQQIDLTPGWQLKQRDPARTLADDFASAEGWLPAQVPGSVFGALIAAGQIADPFYGTNEQDVQWVGERDWLYKGAFTLSAAQLAAGPGQLCFDGLDTFATIWLNGQQLVAAESMFVPQRLAVGELLREGANQITILFESALLRGQALAAEHGPRRVWNGDPSRVYVRKAQYHYGWDWGPCLLDAGIWQAVRLELGTARIADLHCPAELAADLATATLPIRAAIEASDSADLHLDLALHGPDGALVASASVAVSNGLASHSFSLDTPALWWPNGYGAQPRYRLSAILRRGGQQIDAHELALGMRRIRLVQEPLADAPGSSFYFEVNNTPIFGGGANWIPADSFVCSIAPARYKKWVELAAQANMVMLRIWGGGIYEQAAFYEACDELGLLVWQDFMFGCGMYPAHPAFQASVQAEAEAQLRRLRHHPSLALWCGNNEDYEIAQSLGAYDPAFSGEHSASAFPARAIYEQLLPEVCAALDPTRSYWPGSPYGGADVRDQTVGDRHTWEIWHKAMAPYQDYPRFAGRFVSEFGMQSAPHLRTVESFTPPEERHPQSRTFEWHNKAEGGPRRLAVYLSDTVRLDGSMEDYVYGSQLMQAEAMAAAYSGFRRGWGGPGRYSIGGALVWQLNDCWPVTSWAIVDYALRPKPAFYSIRRALAEQAIGMAAAPDGVALWVANGRPAPLVAELLISRYGLDGGLRGSERRALSLGANQVQELGSLARPAADEVIGAQLRLADGTVVARAAYWPEPLKHLHMAEPELTITRLGDEQIQVEAMRPAKGLWLDGGDGVSWSDNMLDLLPGEPQIVTARGLGAGELAARWMR
jgi:beta-mannosidase